jgi:hypothetical protein
LLAHLQIGLVPRLRNGLASNKPTADGGQVEEEACFLMAQRRRLSPHPFSPRLVGKATFFLAGLSESVQDAHWENRFEIRR